MFGSAIEAAICHDYSAATDADQSVVAAYSSTATLFHINPANKERGH